MPQIQYPAFIFIWFPKRNRIIAKKGGAELATEYKSIARGLGEKKIISEALQNKLVEMAGYRNRLVHLYHMMNDEELYEILQKDLRDLAFFVAEINNFIHRQDQ